MKTIKPKKEIKKKKDRTQSFLAIFLLIVLGFSTVGFAFLNRTNNSESNYEKVVFQGEEFYNTGNYWTNGKIVLLNNPLKVGFEKIENISIDNYYQEPLYIYSPETIARTIIAQNLMQVALRLSEACPVDEESCQERDIPIKDCSQNFIILKVGEEEKIETFEKCVYITNKAEDLSKTADKFILSLFFV
jgi:hypothetical protein